MRILMLTVAAVTLAACTPPTETAEAAPATTSARQAEQTPEAFVRGLYLTEQGGTAVRNEDPDAPEVETPPIWSARTGALIDETEALGTPGEYAYFEADPICACQDDGGMMLRTVTMTPRGADRADATVLLEWTMAEPVSTVRQTFNLVREGGAWKIDDIQSDQSQEYPSDPLLQSMTRWIAERRAENAAGAK